MGPTCSYSCFGQTLSNNIVLHIHKIPTLGARLYARLSVGAPPRPLPKKKTIFQCISQRVGVAVQQRQIGTNHFLLHTFAELARDEGKAIRLD